MKALNDLWIFNLEKMIWKKLSSKPFPSERYGHQMCSDEMNKRFYLVGGVGQDGIGYHEIWMFDIISSKFTQLNFQVLPNQPYNLPLYIPTRNSSIIHIGRFLIIYGGETLEDFDIPPILDNILIYDIPKGLLMNSTIESSGDGVYGHSIFLWDDKILCIGGQSGFNSFQNVKYLSIHENRSTIGKFLLKGNLFGEPLEKLSFPLPIIEKTIKYLETNGIKEEGIFRKSGKYLFL